MSVRVHQKHYVADSKKGLVRIATTLGTALCLVAWNMWTESSLMRFVLILATGFVMAGFYSAMHYLSHGTVFAEQKAERRWGLVFSAILLQNFSLYKFFHLKHHQHTGVEGDTEPGGELASLAHYLFYALNWDYYLAFLRMSAMSQRGYFPSFVSRPGQQSQVRTDGRIQLLAMAGAGLLTVAWPENMFFCYWLPLQVAMTLNFFLAFGEHYGCRRTEDPFANTRCFGPKNVIFEWFHWNANYHAEHHLAPRATPWGLKEIHSDLGHRFEYGPVSYVRFNAQAARTLVSDGKLFRSPDFTTAPDFFYPLNKVSQ